MNVILFSVTPLQCFKSICSLFCSYFIPSITQSIGNFQPHKLFIMNLSHSPGSIMFFKFLHQPLRRQSRPSLSYDLSFFSSVHLNLKDISNYPPLQYTYCTVYTRRTVKHSFLFKFYSPAVSIFRQNSHNTFLYV